MSTVSSQSPSSPATSQIVTLPPIPELFDSNFLDVLLPAPNDLTEPAKVPAEVPPNAMMNVLCSTAHRKLTANHAPAFSSTLVSTLDAYLGLRTGISGEEVDRYLWKAWAEDPNLTLRIIWSVRSIHDGKGERELFYRAFGWLFENHPRTAITNLHCLVDPVCLSSNKEQGASHGYWKDLLEILALATLDELKPKVPLRQHSNFLHNYGDGKSRPAFKNNQEQEEWSRTQRVERSRRYYEGLTRKLLDRRYRALYIAVARLFSAQLAKELDIMNKIASLPPNANKDDRVALMHSLSLVSKWAPTPGGSHDRVTNISSAICLLLHQAHVTFPMVHQIPFSPTTNLPTSDVHLLRCFYQKHVLSRGRHYTLIPEPLMSSSRWSEIVYSRVASVCMNKNQEIFFLHDEERFVKYLQDVESGKRHISGATLLPHVLAIQATEVYQQSTQVGTSRSLANTLHEQQRCLAWVQMRVVDAQWATLVARLRESGQLDSCIAVCDVSGSMGSIGPSWRRKSLKPFDVLPIWPAVSLSLLVARLAKPPFKDSFITFSASPQFVTVDPESNRVSLGATIDSMGRAHWGMNTDFNAVFLKLILPLAIEHKVPKDQMIKRIFVFTDMQFDDAQNQNVLGRTVDTRGWPCSTSATTPESVATAWKTNHDVIAEAYAQAGYDVPELVYWDLSNPRDGHGITAPVTSDRKGVALLSGYSPSLLRLFVDVGEEADWEMVEKDDQTRQEKPYLTPEDLMKKALGRVSYDGLVVVD